MKKYILLILIFYGFLFGNDGMSLGFEDSMIMQTLPGFLNAASMLILFSGVFVFTTTRNVSTLISSVVIAAVFTNVDVFLGITKEEENESIFSNIFSNIFSSVGIVIVLVIVVIFGLSIYIFREDDTDTITSYSETVVKNNSGLTISEEEINNSSIPSIEELEKAHSNKSSSSKKQKSKKPIKVEEKEDKPKGRLVLLD